MALLEINGLKAYYGQTQALYGLDFSLEDLTSLSTEKVVRRGIAHVPEGRGTFVRQSVEDNLQLGAYTRTNKKDIADDIERVYSYFPRLRERYKQQAGTLSGGEQQMLAIGRALMLRPRLMLLDEPSFGLGPLVVQEIYGIMQQIREKEGTSMLLVEQNANIALDLADHAYLLETGEVVMSGESQVIRDDENVRKSYLGY